MKKFSYKIAFKESILDTFVATLMNIPINYILLEFIFEWQWNAMQATIFMTTVFMTIAIIRKVWIRRIFWYKYEKNVDK